jgi:CRISPR-associated protein Cmr2
MEASVNTHLQKVEAMGFAPYAEVEHSGYWQTLATGDAQRRFLRFDGDYLYGTFFAKAQVEDALGSTLSVRTERALAEALDSWRALTRRAGEIGIGKPSTYYAVLALDGDEMSDLLSRSPSIDAHRDISEALMRFGAGPVQQMVEDDHPGKLIYSGGDDALALLPVDCALAVADKLAARFSAALVGAGAQGRTASIGIAVVHHLLPLDSALRAAREALQAAKEQYGRAALAIRVLRRSGEQRQVGACWHALHAAAPVDPIETVRTLMAEHKLSGKLAYDLSDEASALAAVPAAHALEIERLLKRHTDRGRWTESERDAQRHALAAELAALASALPILQGLSGIEQLGDWLLLARFLAQGERE